MSTNQKSNTFAQMAATNPAIEARIQAKEKEFSGLISREGAEKIIANEISTEDFSDVAVGDKVKYERPDLNGIEDVVAMFQVFKPAANAERKLTKNKDKEFVPVTAIITYESKNEDGVQNREYISGARAWVQDDGSLSEINFWYKDAAKPTQMITLWETVAKAKGKEPERMSPREFIAFLNGKPKVKIVGVKYDNFNAPRGAPATITKNMPGAFIL